MVSSWSNMGRLEDGYYQSVCLQFSVCVMVVFLTEVAVIYVSVALVFFTKII